MQIINALRHAGHNVSFSMPLDNFLGKKNADSVISKLSETERWACEHFFDPEIVLNRIQPDIALYCNINTFRTIARFSADIIHIVDFYGPLQFEGLLIDAPDYQAAMHDPSMLEARCRAMVNQLRDIDYLVTVSERQKYFWSAYCTLAGFSFADLNVLVCPAAFDVPVVPRAIAPNLTVVYSGGFYPWQNPNRFLREAAAVLEEIDGATLHIFGGPHTGMPNQSEVIQMLDDLQRHRCVKYHGYRPVEEVIETLATAWCALELMEQNIERELAITGRTLEFLSSGTPVIYNNYSTLSKLIRDYQAGWTLSASGDSGLRSALHELANGGPGLVETLSQNAKRLAACEFSADLCMQPLLDLCKGDVRKRPKTPSMPARVASPPSDEKSLGRVLAISPDTRALRELRISNPLRALQRQGYIDSARTVTTFFQELNNDATLYNVILVQRAIPEFIIQTLHNLSLPFVLDCDDNLLSRAAYRSEPPETEIIPGLRHCSVLTAPNPRLVLALERYSGLSLRHKSFVTPNALPYPADVSNERGQPQQLLWIQSDIAALANSRSAVVNAVEDFSRKYGLPVVLIGPNVLAEPPFTHRVLMGELDFTANLQVLEFAPRSIGVAPLETDADAGTMDFVAGKSDLKMLLFAGYGHAGVYSAAPPYTDSPLQDGLSIVGNTYEEWIAALEHQYRHAWREIQSVTARIQRERHIDRVARESWAPALRACLLKKPIRGMDLYEALQAAYEMDGGPLRSVAYMFGNRDVGEKFLTGPGPTAWNHYVQHGIAERRQGNYSSEKHKQFLERVNQKAVDFFARAVGRMAEYKAAANSSEKEIEKLQREIANLNTAISHIANSRSWKLTAPMRKIAGLVRKH